MQTRIDTTFSGKNISSAVSVYEYIVPVDGMYSFQVRLAAVEGNDDYEAYLTLNDGDAQSDDMIAPKTTATLASGQTAVWFATLKVAALAGDVINIFILGVNYAVAGDEMDLVDAPNTTGIAAFAAAVWTYVTRILTNTAAATGSVADGSNLTLTNKVSFAATITGLTIPTTWEEFYLTVKLSLKDEDSEAILQMVVSKTPAATDGILYVNRVAATTAEKALGTLVVDQGAGTVAIAIADDIDFDHIGEYTYDLKYNGAGNESFKPAASANFTIQRTETRTHNEGA